jgi:hypothetical protein
MNAFTQTSQLENELSPLNNFKVNINTDSQIPVLEQQNFPACWQCIYTTLISKNAGFSLSSEPDKGGVKKYV